MINSTSQVRALITRLACKNVRVKLEDHIREAVFFGGFEAFLLLVDFISYADRSGWHNNTCVCMCIYDFSGRKYLV